MTPTLSEFNPKEIPWQFEALKKIRKGVDYNDGLHEFLFSGSVGSAKSLLSAHIAVTHCLFFPGARLLLGRRTLPDIKSTIYRTILDHLDDKGLKEGFHYFPNNTNASIGFFNGSEIISRSWADKRYSSKFRSLELSAAIIEELTENDSEECKAFHDEMIARVGRINPTNSLVKENFIVYNTNPDDPTHWAYDYFMLNKNNHRHVFYSLTEQNKFLPKSYINRLKEIYDSKMIQRMLYGKWIFIKSDVIYYEYVREKHFVLKNTKPIKELPLRFSFDFNIALNKPMSCLMMQYDNELKKFYCIDEFVIDGSRTNDIMEEIASRGYLDLSWNPKIIIHGDYTGRRRDTRGTSSDYDLIDKFLSNYERKDREEIDFDIDVPLARNPPVRTRHNTVNGQLCNSEGIVSILIDERCKVLDEGLSKTKLKKGGKYIEDDSNSYQHLTTALGYAVCSIIDDGTLEQEILLG